MNKHYRYLSLILLTGVYFQAQGMWQYTQLDEKEKEELQLLVQDGKNILEGNQALLAMEENKRSELEQLTFAHQASVILEIYTPLEKRLQKKGTPLQAKFRNRIVELLGSEEAAQRRLNFLDDSRTEDTSKNRFGWMATLIKMRNAQAEKIQKRKKKLATDLGKAKEAEETKRKEYQGEFRYLEYLKEAQTEIDIREEKIAKLVRQIENLEGEISKIEENCDEKYEACDNKLDSIHEEMSKKHELVQKFRAQVEGTEDAEALVQKDAKILRAFLTAQLKENVARKQELDEIDYTPIAELKEEIKEQSALVEKEENQIKKSNRGNQVDIKQTQLDKLETAQKELKEKKDAIYQLNVAIAKADGTYSRLSDKYGSYNAK